MQKAGVMWARHSDGDTQQPAAAAAAALSISSEFIIYSGKKGGGATVLRGGGHDYSLNVNIFGKTAVLHFVLTPYCGQGCANSACGLLGIAVLMSSSHRFLILHSPQETTLLKKIIQYRIQREMKKMYTQFLTPTIQ
jgi:hypothetical protein